MREVIVRQKTHLLVSLPHITYASHYMDYEEYTICGRDPRNLDTTLELAHVDCGTCRAWIDKRQR